jgi:hypothetical protein
MPPAFGSDGHKIGFPKANAAAVGQPSTARPTTAMTSLGLTKHPNDTPGPGPGKYSCRGLEFEQNGKSGKSILGHHDFEYDKIHSPGPAAYRPRYERVQRQSPRYTIKHVPKKKDPKPTAEYRALASTLAGYRYTMKARPTDEIRVH